MTDLKYKRTGNVLNKKYIQYLIPTLLSAIGLSLSEFADSMIVSHLLGTEAFAVVNLASPIVLMVSMVYQITGLGGSLLFAEYLGKKTGKMQISFFRYRQH